MTRFRNESWDSWGWYESGTTKSKRFAVANPFYVFQFFWYRNATGYIFPFHTSGTAFTRMYCDRAHGLLYSITINPVWSNRCVLQTPNVHLSTFYCNIVLGTLHSEPLSLSICIYFIRSLCIAFNPTYWQIECILPPIYSKRMRRITSLWLKLPQQSQEKWTSAAIYFHSSDFFF